MKKHKKLYISLGVIGGIIAILVGFFFGYVSIYYHADSLAEQYLTSDEKVEVYQGEGGYVFKPVQEAKAEFIFYPGGKVEYTAYAPFMHMLAANGIYSVISKMAFNLAFLSLNKADKALDHDLPKYIGGHSLGGVGATTYLANNYSLYQGLILMGAYSTKDLSSTSLKTLSLLGENDQVLDKEAYEKNKGNLPNLTEFVIDGGIHSYFGSYGHQKGDGEASITCIDQQTVIATQISNFVLKE